MGQADLKSAKNAILLIAQREGVSVEHVRTEMKVAMLNGLCSTDPKIKSYWESIPCEGNIPTPEEFIAFTAKMVKVRRKI